MVRVSLNYALSLYRRATLLHFFTLLGAHAKKGEKYWRPFKSSGPTCCGRRVPLVDDRKMTELLIESPPFCVHVVTSFGQSVTYPKWTWIKWILFSASVSIVVIWTWLTPLAETKFYYWSQGLHCIFVFINRLEPINQFKKSYFCCKSIMWNLFPVMVAQLKHLFSDLHS